MSVRGYLVAAMLVIMGSLLANTGLSVSIQVCAQGEAVSLSDRDGDPQLFEILIQRFPAEVDLARCEKVPHVSFEFRCGEADDPAAHAAQPLFGEQLVHLLPVRFHKSPGQFSAIDIAQDGADEKRRVLRADFSADGAGECAFEQCLGLECREREEIAPFFLRCGGGAEPFVKFVVPGCVARMREDRDERGHDIGVNGCRVVAVSPVQLGCASLDGRIIAEFTLCADQFTPQLFRQLALAASGDPTQVCNGGTDPTAYERFERRPILHGDDPVQKGEGVE